jgi:hypothetical protein
MTHAPLTDRVAQRHEIATTAASEAPYGTIWTIACDCARVPAGV